MRDMPEKSRTLQSGALIEFDRKKHFKYIKPLGSGGTGDTHLFEDETTDMLFAFKKYAPKDSNHIDEYYSRFVDEIKILFQISHPNIVRVYNHYLYPESKLGYLQMEYVNGVEIDRFETNIFGRQWDDIFLDVISAFKYLESIKILHRDIRPANILIDQNEHAKIIDFGFGKRLSQNDKNVNSVILNWPVTEFPAEVNHDGTYNHQTEVYFVGKLFKKLLLNKDCDFSYDHILDKMIKVDPIERYNSFDAVLTEISEGVLSGLDFSDFEMRTYQIFADHLVAEIASFKEHFEPKSDIRSILKSMALVIKNNSLETYIQNTDKLIRCFTNIGFRYRNRNAIPVTCFKEFYNLLNGLNSYKQNVVLTNLYNRLNKIKVEEDLPF